MLYTKTLHANKVSHFAILAERLGREGVSRAILEHKAAGNPIYFTNDKGKIIKELADGRQFTVKILLNGIEKIGKQIN